MTRRAEPALEQLDGKVVAGCSRSAKSVTAMELASESASMPATAKDTVTA